MGWGYIFFPNVQIKLHFCSEDAVFFGSLYLKCLGSFCRSPAIGIADCCMESICCNTEIPAVTVCPERDYRIFLNWSSIHLSIKIRSQGQEHNSSIKCTWGIYNTQQDCYNQPLKRAYFWNFIIPVVPCFYRSHRIGFCWLPPCGNSGARPAPHGGARLPPDPWRPREAPRAPSLPTRWGQSSSSPGATRLPRFCS